MRPLLLDVTKAEQVQSVADRVGEENPQGVFALVNNAGACLCVYDDGLGVSIDQPNRPIMDHAPYVLHNRNFFYMYIHAFLL